MFAEVRYLHRTQQIQDMNIHALSVIGTRVPRNPSGLIPMPEVTRPPGLVSAKHTRRVTVQSRSDFLRTGYKGRNVE